MRRYRVVALLSLILIAVLVSFWRGAQIADKVSYYLSGGRAPNYDDCDERWRTSMKLNHIQWSLGRFACLADDADRQAARDINTIHDLWRVVHKKIDISGRLVPSEFEEEYLDFTIDGWGRPFAFQRISTKESFAIRISVTNQDYHRWVELGFDDAGVGKTQSSWLLEQ